MIHLSERRGWIIDNAPPPTGSMAVFIHLNPTTHACGKLDVIFSVAIRDNGRDAALPRKLSGVGARADLIRIGFSPIGESTVLPIALVIDGKVVCKPWRYLKQLDCWTAKN
jgi:hypothetical protein